MQEYGLYDGWLIRLGTTTRSCKNENKDTSQTVIYLYQGTEGVSAGNGGTALAGIIINDTNEKDRIAHNVKTFVPILEKHLRYEMCFVYQCLSCKYCEYILPQYYDSLKKQYGWKQGLLGAGFKGKKETDELKIIIDNNSQQFMK